MLSFLILIGVIIGYFSLSNRIKDLEKKIGATSAPKPAAPVAVVQEDIPVAPTPITPQPQAEFNEEAGGRWLGKLGIAAVFVGVAFFLKYAFDTGLIGVVGRIVLGLLLGAAFIIGGRHIKARYENYGNLMMGGGIALLYLTLYAAFNFYALISQPVAFFAMILVTGIIILLSWFDRSLLLATLGILGGLATPYLISTGTNSPITLFTYLAFLDIAVVFVSFREKWHPLVYLAFIGTLIQFGAWYGSYYTPSQLHLAFFFATLFFAIFHLVTYLRIARNVIPEEDQEILLVSANAFVYFAGIYSLLDPLHHGSIWLFTIGLSLLYFGIAYMAYKSLPTNKYLSVALAGIATIFLTITVPLKFTGEWITLAWLLEGLVLSGISVSLKRPWLQAFGACVYGLGLIKLFAAYSLDTVLTKSYAPFFNQNFALFVVAILIAYLLAYLYYKNPGATMGSSHTSLASIFLLVANLLSIFIITSEVSNIFDKQILGMSTYNNSYADSVLNQKNTVISIIWTIYSLILLAIGFSRRSKVFRIFGLVFFFVTAAKVFVDVWSLGQLYRIVSSIIFGALALAASFAYAKYGHRMKDLILNQ